jgi:hypothetical protein
MQSVVLVAATISFNDVRDDRIRRLPQLRAQLESLGGWKRLQRQLVELDEHIIGALPGDERMMSEIGQAIGVVQGPCR